ncbi:hypothetical protein AVEN_266208-1 [Araneus ventricosus]|uniref:Uncharacterized protein n=1 Tax=Araneus ventricosus TaxID=182803 RepID=A0A4Y2N3M0_ARAVE|nr:hypothetical protein AVEN_266208-1 [Araneus ventricosus]
MLRCRSSDQHHFRSAFPTEVGGMCALSNCTFYPLALQRLPNLCFNLGERKSGHSRTLRSTSFGARCSKTRRQFQNPMRIGAVWSK